MSQIVVLVMRERERWQKGNERHRELAIVSLPFFVVVIWRYV